MQRILNSHKWLKNILLAITHILVFIVTFLLAMHVPVINNVFVFIPSFITAEGVLILFGKLVSFPSTPLTKIQHTENAPLASGATPPIIEQASQETRARIISIQPLENKPALVGRAPEQVVTKPLPTSPAFYNPEDIFHFNQTLYTVHL